MDNKSVEKSPLRISFARGGMHGSRSERESSSKIMSKFFCTSNAVAGVLALVADPDIVGVDVEVAITLGRVLVAEDKNRTRHRIASTNKHVI